MLTMLATLILSAPVPEEMPPLATGEPVLIAKGKGFLIHAVPSAGKSPTIPIPMLQLAPHQTIVLSNGTMLFHTSTETGKMKSLLQTSTTVRQSPPMGIDRQYFNSTQIVGLSADAERLYVLLAQRQSTILLQGRPMNPPESVPATYTLAVFSLEDGMRLHSLPLKEGDFPKEAPPETTGIGPLVGKENGVICFGVSFTFKGKELGEQKYEKK
jgi:hypothetical protein